MPRRI
ncbi:hypothetical protein CGLO_11619 [Colletotrichum gloeosporioides Cg-14]|jgi:hypothetical protein